MDLLKNMNGAIKFIEENLTNEIDFKEVARLAYCSEYHFKRMFSFPCRYFTIRVYPPKTTYTCAV